MSSVVMLMLMLLLLTPGWLWWVGIRVMIPYSPIITYLNHQPFYYPCIMIEL